MGIRSNGMKIITIGDETTGYRRGDTLIGFDNQSEAMLVLWALGNLIKAETTDAGKEKKPDCRICPYKKELIRLEDEQKAIRSIIENGVVDIDDCDKS